MRKYAPSPPVDLLNQKKRPQRQRSILGERASSLKLPGAGGHVHKHGPRLSFKDLRKKTLTKRKKRDSRKIRHANPQNDEELEIVKALKGQVIGEEKIPFHSYGSQYGESQAEVCFSRYCDEYAAFSPATVHRLLDHYRKRTGLVDPVPSVTNFFATLFFADISGFTRLSSILGAEELKQHINRYFGMLIGVINRFGGDVVKFCGDAVLVIWPNVDVEYEAGRFSPRTPETPVNRKKVASGLVQVSMPLVHRSNAVRAGKCALAIMEQCGEYDHGTDESKVSLRLHCGLGAGRMFGYNVGSGDRWEFLISGDPLRQIAEAESEASRGQIVASPEAWGLMDRRLVAERTAGGNYLILPPTGDELPAGRTRGTSIAASLTSLPASVSFFGEKVSSRVSAHRKKMSTVFGAGSTLPQSLVPSLNRAVSDPSLQSGASPLPGWTQRMKTQTKAGGLLMSESELNVLAENAAEDAAQDYLGDYLCAQTKHSSGLVLLPVTIAIRGYVHASARAAIESENMQYLSELRGVTTMFINVVGLARSLQTGSLPLVQHVMEIGQSCLAKFRGTMRQYVVDDKGCVMIGAFGLPGSSHVDDNERAIQCASYIRTLLQQSDLHSKIGITRGAVYCGIVGTVDRCEYAMMGASVNLAARLMASCPLDDIRVDHEVHRDTPSSIEFERLDAIDAKGYEHPVPVFRPLEQKNKTSTFDTNGTHPTFGRDEEMDVIRRAVAKVIRGQPVGPLFMSAEAGSGKSHLLREAMRFCRESDVVTLMGVCSEHEKSTPFFAWRNILRGIFKVRVSSAHAGKYGTTQGGLGAVRKGLTVRCAISSDLNNSHANESTPPDDSFQSTMLGSSQFLTPPDSPVSPITLHNMEEAQTRERRHVRSFLVDMERALRTKEEVGGLTASLNNSANEQTAASDQQQNDERRRHTVHLGGPFEGADAVVSVAQIPSRLAVRLRESNPKLAALHITTPVRNGPLPRRILHKRASDVPRVDTGRSMDRTRSLSPLSAEVPGARINNVQLAPLLDAVISVGFEDNNVTSALNTTGRLKLTAELIVEVIRYAGTQAPRCILIEDCHWMDSVSWRVLADVARDAPNVLLIIALRPLQNFYSQPPPEAEFVCQAEGGRRLELKPLDAAGCYALARDTLGEKLLARFPELLPPNASEILLHRSSGNPLFVRNLAYSLRDRVVQGHDVKLEDLPSGIQNIFLCRYDELEPAEQMALKAGSVIGASFSTELLTYIYPGDRTSVHASLVHLIRSNFLSRREEQGDPVFSFLHETVRETIYGLMLKEDVEPLHRKVAQWYEQHYPGNHAYFALLVHHYSHTNDFEKRVEYLQRAAAHSKKTHAYHETIHFFSELVSLVFGTHDPTSSIVSKRGLTWRTLRAHHRMLVQGRRAMTRSMFVTTDALKCGEVKHRWLPRAQFRGVSMFLKWGGSDFFSVHQVGHWLAEIAFAYSGLGHNEEAYNRMQMSLLYLGFEALSTTSNERLAASARRNTTKYTCGLLRRKSSAEREERTSDDVQLAAKLHAHLAFMCFQRGVSRGVGQTIRRQMLEMEKYGGLEHTPEYAQLNACMAVLAASIADHNRAREYLLVAERVCDNLGDAAEESAMVASVAAAVHGGFGDWSSVAAANNSALQLYRKIGDVHRRGGVLVASALAHVFRGETVAARCALEEAFSVGLQDDDGASQSLVAACQAHALVDVMNGDAESSGVVLAEARAMLGGESADGDATQAALMAHTELQKGHFESSLKYAATASRSMDRSAREATQYTFGIHMHLVADVFLTLIEHRKLASAADETTAHKAARVLSRALTRMSAKFPVLSAFAQLCTGRLALLRRKPALAVAMKCFDRGEQDAKAFALDSVRGLLIFQHGRCMVNNPESRRKRFRQAAEMFASCPAVYDLQRVKWASEGCGGPDPTAGLVLASIHGEEASPPSNGGRSEVET